MAIHKKSKHRLPERLNLRLPTALPSVIETAAEQRFLSVSEFVRLALIDQLVADGFDLHAHSVQAA